MSSVVRSRIAGEIDVLALVGSSLLSGLLMQSTLDCWPRWSPRTGSDSAYQAVASAAYAGGTGQGRLADQTNGDSV
jgi:hypothetical protein